MLSTLMRYDFKRQFKRILPVCGAVLLCAGLFVFAFWRITNLSEIETYFTIPYAFLMIISVFAIPAGCFAVFILIFVHFYKNLMSDEGYLTFTLPVTHNEILASKVISGSVCTFVGIFVMIAAYMILFLGMESITVGEVIVDEADLSFIGGTSGLTTLILSTILAGVLGIVRTVIQVFFAIILGGMTAKTHKVWGAIGFYILSNMAINMVNTIVMVPFGILTAASEANPMILMSVLMILNAVVEAILCVVLYLWSLRLLERKLNLQ